MERTINGITYKGNAHPTYASATSAERFLEVISTVVLSLTMAIQQSSLVWTLKHD